MFCCLAGGLSDCSNVFINFHSILQSSEARQEDSGPNGGHKGEMIFLLVETAETELADQL